jgi:selenide,water dikinase
MQALFALNIAAFLPIYPPSYWGRSCGGAETVRSVGAAIGAHTTQDKEPKYGLAVTGMVHPDHILTKGGARPGDRLIAKAVGYGTIDRTGAIWWSRLIWMRPLRA